MKKIKIPFTDKVIVDEKFLTERERYKECFDNLNKAEEIVLQNKWCKYEIWIGIDYYVVCMLFDNIKIPIKSFPFGDDKEYAKLCAEELCEMLNSKI